MSGRVAFLDSVHPVLWERLVDAGHECVHCESLPREAILSGELQSAIGIVLRSRMTIDKELLRALPQLKWIARSGSGLENIDLEAAKLQGITVHSSPEGNATSVGEHAVGQLLMMLHKLRAADLHVREGGWNRELHRGVELESRTVGIVGFGNMGRSFAKCLQGFGCRVLAYDKYVSGFDGIYEVNEVAFKEVQEECDVVSLHVPLSEETRFLVNTDWIQSMRKPFFLLNTSRGEVIKTEALLNGLDEGNVLGAALDVLEFEKRSLEELEARPLLLQRLIDHPKTVLSPHVAGWSVESYQKLSSVLADKILG